MSASGEVSPLVGLLRQQNRIVAGGLVVLTALGWFYLVAIPMPMPAGVSSVWSPAYLLLSIGMWFVMMVAMMTPSVAPVVLLYDRVMHGNQPGWHSRTLAFLSGYLVVWAGFSATATLGQAMLIHAGIIDAMGVIGARRLAAVLLLAVALYQWSAAKAACLERCHSPLAFIVGHRRGPYRDLRAGLAHGTWCVGCCGGLMLLLFVGGVMNLAWVAVITALVAVEKLAPQPQRARKVIGIGILLAALWFLIVSS